MVATAAVLVELSQAVVWGPRQGGVRGRGEIQPIVMEIPDASGKSLSEAAEKTINRYSGEKSPQIMPESARAHYLYKNFHVNTQR